MRLLHVLLGVVAGLLVGALGCVVYPGPVDLPWVGLVLAAALVGSGAWFLLEWGKHTAWFGYAVGVTVAADFALVDKWLSAAVTPSARSSRQLSPSQVSASACVCHS